MHDVEVIYDAGVAVSVLDPVRRRLLHALREPRSAAQLAEGVGLTRQNVNYHLRALERQGLVRQALQRRWGGITERLMTATARSYVVSPAMLGELGCDPRALSDQLSANYLIALGARLVREVGGLKQRAEAKGKRVATFAVDAEIRFASAEDRALFAEELGEQVRGLAARYHCATADSGRTHRLLVAVHAVPAEGDKPTRGEEGS